MPEDDNKDGGKEAADELAEKAKAQTGATDELATGEDDPEPDSV